MTDTPAPAKAVNGRFDHIFYVLRSNPVTLIAFAMLGFILFCATLRPSLVPYDPLATNAANALQSPSAAHWFGTDQIGRGRKHPEPSAPRRSRPDVATPDRRRATGASA
jgi:peptide/nickel transport system permease protein